MSQELQPKFKKVMIIDDNSIDLYVTSRMITKNIFGKEVIECISAEEALQYLKANENNISALPEIILVDIYMPLMSGFEFMEEYDKLSPTLKNHCRAFILSSSIDELDMTRAENDKNVVSFQVKPITKQFLESINSSHEFSITLKSKPFTN